MDPGRYVPCPSCGNGNRARDFSCSLCGAVLARVPAPTGLDEVAREVEHLEASWRWYFHLAVLALAAWMAVPYFTKSSHYGVLEYAILPFHEAGHYALMLFAPEFLVVAGGTLAQLGLPLGFAAYFLWKQRDPFAACVAAFWLCASVQNMAVYMKDARFLLLPLLGVDPLEGHDWNYLFGKLHLMHQSVEIGNFFQGLGRVGMLAVLAAMAWVVLRERPVRPAKAG